MNHIIVLFMVFCFNFSFAEEKEEFKWLNSKEGITEEVLAPWTPIEVKQEKDKGLRVKVWGRVYQFNNSPFPTSIETKGNSILAKPIRIIAKVDGNNVNFEWSSIQIEKEKPDVIVFTQIGRGEGLKLLANTEIEYDGMIRVDWKIVPERSLTLEEITFEMPMVSKYARYIWRPSNWVGVKPGFIPKNGIKTGFIPMIWFGDEECGIEWFCESEKDWYVTRPTRSIEVFHENNIVMLRLHIVDKVINMRSGVRIAHESGIPVIQPEDNVVDLSYTFGLQATPVKPIEKDVWDYRFAHVGAGAWDTGTTRYTADRFNIPESQLDSVAKAGVKTIVLHEHWTDIYGYTSTTSENDPNRVVYDKALKKLIKECHKRGIKVLLYLGLLMSDIAPEWFLFGEKCIMLPKNEWDFSNAPPFPPQKPCNVCNRSVWQDFLVYGLSKVMMDDYDIDGIYLDSTANVWGGCKNTLHGCGYINLNGEVVRTFAIFPNREIMKRFYTVIKKRKPDGQVNFHNSKEMLIPALSWATSFWNGEDLPKVPKHALLLDVVPLDAFRTEFMGRQWGVPAEFLESKLTDEYQKAFALSLLHDVPVRIWYFMSGIWKLMDEFGRKESEWLPYWRNSEYVEVNPETAYVSLYKHPKNGVLVVVSNLGEKEAKVKVKLNLKNLKLKSKLSALAYHVMSNILYKDSLNITDNTFELVLDSENFKIIWVKEIKEM